MTYWPGAAPRETIWLTGITIPGSAAKGAGGVAGISGWR